MSAIREARLELDAPLRHPLPLEEAQALVALLGGSIPCRPAAHPLFRHPDAASLLVGESLDHATRGSRVVQEDGTARLLASASLPPCPVLLSAGLDWLGGLLALQPGEVPGFIIPPGAARHDQRLLAWDGERLRPLGPLPEPEETAPPRCSPTAFREAAGLPAPEATEPPILRLQLRRLALAQLRGQCLPVAQSRLDGPFHDGQAMFRRWMAETLARLDGLTTTAPPLFQAA
ncbi:hypothetical protein [Roseomonas marmotae]|uniref:Uncharacterized protein n=1 Tax=Roseomonas marmotae TaxID=2768161 RepID=A0ABS3KF76_9PROT|nr:hypothetical protein [Roseomonas marmotae]MBO1076119.1 hypothetical protein [Roseomonas marmotae]QTI81253.1 hypothetical protein IAI58_18010 [Roseomonas marmotae]